MVSCTFPIRASLLYISEDLSMHSLINFSEEVVRIISFLLRNVYSEIKHCTRRARTHVMLLKELQNCNCAREHIFYTTGNLIHGLHDVFTYTSLLKALRLHTRTPHALYFAVLHYHFTMSMVSYHFSIRLKSVLTTNTHKQICIFIVDR